MTEQIIHADMVRRLAKPGSAIRATLTTYKVSLLTAAVTLFVTSAKILEELQQESIFESDENTHLHHMAIGMAGEAGELLDVIKKIAAYNKDQTVEIVENIIEELGDFRFYWVGYEQGRLLGREADKEFNTAFEQFFALLSLNMAHVEANNIAKLSKRYRELVYSDNAAIERADKVETGETVSSSADNGEDVALPK